VSDKGTVFRISPSGTFTNLYSFSGGSDGANPEAGLVQGSDGDFYGTTYSGGTSNHGTVFKMTASGSFTNLYSFRGGDGANPRAALVQGGDGYFYGTTTYGGNSCGCGTIFKISPSGVFTNLYSFNGDDGCNPYAGLVQGSDGNFYGVTYDGGAFRSGSVFKMRASGTLTNLYSFADLDGADPDGGLVQGSDGNFYGTTAYGGTSEDGTVFKLTVPLNPPANQISAFQISGNDIAVSIPSVAGETYQLQFTADLKSGIWSNIPGVSITNSIGGPLTLTNFGGALGAQGFYRFAITP
jgi:uncharacterized repeat protein (TIGR03803 family)